MQFNKVDSFSNLNLLIFFVVLINSATLILEISYLALYLEFF